MATFTVVQSTNGSLNKSFDENGNKTSNALLSAGKYQVATIDSVKGLIEYFSMLGHNNAIIAGVPKNNLQSGDITSGNNTNGLTRTKTNFEFNGTNILCFDYDPDADGFEVSGPEHYAACLRYIDPSLKDVEIGVSYGSSYGIVVDGEPLANKMSLHAYILISNATTERVDAYKESFRNACWKLGFGHIKISKSGSLLRRQIFDDVVFSPERLLFEASPTLASNVTTNRPAPFISGAEGVARDLLNIDENDGLGDNNFIVSRNSMRPQATIVQAKHIDEKSNELMISQGITKEVALETITNKIKNNKLMPNDILFTKEGSVCVSDIISNSVNYKNCAVLDPIDPRNNEFHAVVYVNNDGSINVNTLRHGGVTYNIKGADEMEFKMPEPVVGGFVMPETPTVVAIEETFEPAPANNTSVELMLSNVQNVVFPDTIQVSKDASRPTNTPNNLKALLAHLTVDAKYDEILKIGGLRSEIDFENFNKDTDDRINSQFMKIKGQCVRAGLPEKIVEYLPSVIDDKSYNPMKVMIDSKTWDGVDRVSQVIGCVHSTDNPIYKTQIMTKWFTQCVAAWDHSKNTPIDGALPRFESVMVFVGGQGVSKTKFFEGLLGNDYRKYVKPGVSLDVHKNDSKKIAIGSAICELGELDSTFLRDIGGLKAFLSESYDKFRLPYARSESEFKRRTSFCASVNNTEFLVDPTGNRRFQPISVDSIDYTEYMSIDKQQLWAQVYAMYIDGLRWWIDKDVKEDAELYDMLNVKHIEHEIKDVADEAIDNVIRNTLMVAKGGDILPPLAGALSSQIASHYGIAANKRGLISKIKKALIADDRIEYNGHTFLVRLM